MSSNETFAAFFTVLAALSQGLGGLIAVFGLKGYDTSIAHSLSFSAGVMLYISFMDIMPDTSREIGAYASSMALLMGMAIFLCLEFVAPETDFVETCGMITMKPKELATPEQDDTSKTPTILRQRSQTQASGSSEWDSSPCHQPRGTLESPSCLRAKFAKGGENSMPKERKQSIAFTGMMAMLSISLHNIPEGIAVYLTCLKGVRSGLPFAVAMALHNIPEGIAVATPLYAATKSKTQAVMAATISGGFEIIGAVIVQMFFKSITPFYTESLLSVVAGIMIMLSLVELLPSCLEIVEARIMGVWCLSGMVFMFVTKTASTSLIERYN